MGAKAQSEGRPIMMMMIILLSNIIRSYFYYVVAQSTGQAAHCAQLAVWPLASPPLITVVYTIYYTKTSLSIKLVLSKHFQILNISIKSIIRIRCVLSAVIESIDVLPTK